MPTVRVKIDAREAALVWSKAMAKAEQWPIPHRRRSHIRPPKRAMAAYDAACRIAAVCGAHGVDIAAEAERLGC